MANELSRETASKILNEYLAKVGGKKAILAAWQEKKETAKKGKKRNRAGTGAEAPNGTKRGKKNGHPKDESPPASVSKAEWKPPTGSWEEAVTGIDACEGNDNNVVVYLTWKGGHKTQHPLSQVYKRCPQKMLKFYESHLFVPPFRPTETALTIPQSVQEERRYGRSRVRDILSKQHENPDKNPQAPSPPG